jgi:putative thioredoxin
MNESPDTSPADRSAPKVDTSQYVIDTSEADFERDVFQRSHEVPVVVDFWATWCQPCRLLGPMLEQLAAEHTGAFVLVKAETEQVPRRASEFGVSGIPAVYAVRGGKIVDSFVGVLSEPQLREWIARILPSEAEQLVAAARALEADDPDAAEAHYRSAMLADVRDAAAKIALASLLLSLDRVDDCAVLVAELEARGFMEPAADRVRAELSIRQHGDAAGDVATLREAVAATPDDLAAQLRLSEALAAAGEHEEALELALGVVQKDFGDLRQQARQVMVDMFGVLPSDSPLVSDYRRRLSTSLY